MGEGMKIVAFKIEGNGTFAKDVPAIAEAVKASGADLVLMPGNSRVKRSAPAAAFRAGAEIDTNIVDVEIADGRPSRAVGFTANASSPSSRAPPSLE